MREVTCSQQELSEWLGLSDRRIRELTKSGILKRGTTGYHVKTSVQAYIQFLRSEPGNLTDERARLTRAQADLAELKLRQRQGELVLRDSVDQEWFRLTRAARDNFLNLPARTDALVAAESDRQKCFDILTREVRQILEELTDEVQED